MDDILGSVETEEKACRVTTNIDNMLNGGGFTIKEWMYSYQNKKPKPMQMIQSEGAVEKILGLQWDSLDDTCVFNELILPKIGEAEVTKRLILSTVNRIYDPLGLLSPFTLKFKILLREVWAHVDKFDWDDVLPTDIQKEWLSIKEEMDELKYLRFKRSLTPAGYIGQPQLIIFSDGSSKAFGAVAYVRWLTDKGYEMRLIMSKCRIAPVKMIDIVRLELCGALLSTRLRSFILKECDMGFKQVYHFTDSEVVKAMIGKSSYGFDTFHGNRLGEIHRQSVSEEWFWIPGVLNIADKTTRGCSPAELGQNSEWQNGPDVFKEPEAVWTNFTAPIPEVIPGLKADKDKTVHLVGETLHIIAEVNDSLVARIDIHRYSQYSKLIRVTARVLAMYKAPPSLKNAVDEISLKDIGNAESFWVREAQKSITEEELQSKYVTLGPKRRTDGLIKVGRRMERWMEMTYNNNDLLLLPYDHPMSKLYVLEIHNNLHLSGYTGITATTCKVRLKFWITRLETMVKSIKHKCVDCKKMNKERLKESQVMAQLPVDRLKPAPPWYSITIDFFGPIETKGEVNKRSRGKVYGVVFTCNLIRAVHIDISPDYGTDSFLSALRRFMALRGAPSLIRSDRGSQLVGASRELKKMILGLNLQQLKQFGVNKGFEWDFSPAEAPWYNGCAESMVRAVKKAMTAILKGKVLSHSELVTVVYEISNLLNERPIGKQSNDIDDGTYLCPNDLLLGRATARIPSGPFEQNVSSKKRRSFIQSLVDAFWVKMTRFYFPSLIIEQKWHTESRNVRVGDIVLLQDSNAIRGEWRLARISKTHPSCDGKVRKVTLSYRRTDDSLNYSGGLLTNIERPVQNLVVILPCEDQ